jgi:8-oxo-dGTP diphosphatase
MSQQTRHLSAGAIVVDRDRILLVQSRSGHWGLPKGHWEPNESLAAAAAREVLEETGLMVAVQDLAFITEFYSEHGRDQRVQFFFVAHPLGGEPKPRPGEIVAVRWVPKEEVAAFIRWKPWLDPLRHWLDGGGRRYFAFPDPSGYRLARDR